MICKLLDVHSALQDRFGRVLGQIANFTPQTRSKSLLAKYFANSEILQTAAQKITPSAKVSGWANMLLACWPILGSEVRSEAFHSMFYNFITPRQHLGNAHNIK
jgi:hypothetical protein